MRGLRVKARQVALLCSLSSATACLVIDRFEYGEPNVPPHLTRVAPLSFTRVPPEPDVECNSESGDLMRFTVAVSDANLEDPLQAKLVINGRQVADSVISVTGVAERADLTLCAPGDALKDPCSHVVVAVTRQFAFGALTEPAEPGDVSTLEWWVLGAASENASAGPEDCALRLTADGGLP